MTLFEAYEECPLSQDDCAKNDPDAALQPKLDEDTDPSVTPILEESKAIEIHTSSEPKTPEAASKIEQFEPEAEGVSYNPQDTPKSPSFLQTLVSTESGIPEKRATQVPLRSKTGRIIPAPFLFHKSQRCQKHINYGPKKDAYIPLAVCVKEFENIRNLQYPTCNHVQSKWPHSPTKPKSPLLLTKLRRKDNLYLKSSRDVEEWNTKPFRATPFNPKIFSTPQKDQIPRNKRKPTVPMPFLLPGDSISQAKREKFKRYKTQLETQMNKNRDFCAARSSCGTSSIGSLPSSATGSEIQSIIDRIRPPRASSTLMSTNSSSNELNTHVFRASRAPLFDKIFIPKKSERKLTKPLNIVLQTDLRSKKRKSLYEKRLRSAEKFSSIPSITPLNRSDVSDTQYETCSLKPCNENLYMQEKDDKNIVCSTTSLDSGVESSEIHMKRSSEIICGK